MSSPASTGRLTGRLGHSWSGRRRWPLVSVAGGLLVTGAVLVPVIFLVVQAQQSGWDHVRHLLLRHTTAVLLWNSLRLTVACTLLCAALGVGAAWLVERTDVPLPRVCGV